MLISAKFANSQPVFSNDNDSICVTLDHYKIILQYAYRGKACDSLITTYDTTIHNFETIIQKKDVQLQLTQTIVTGQAVKIKRLKWACTLLSSGVGIITILFFLK